jgi:hypothetical protein
VGHIDDGSRSPKRSNQYRLEIQHAWHHHPPGDDAVHLTSDSLIPLDHPIRRIKPVVKAMLAELAPEFDAMYARAGRHSTHSRHGRRRQLTCKESSGGGREREQADHK